MATFTAQDRVKKDLDERLRSLCDDLHKEASRELNVGGDDAVERLRAAADLVWQAHKRLTGR